MPMPNVFLMHRINRRLPQRKGNFDEAFIGHLYSPLVHLGFSSTPWVESARIRPYWSRLTAAVRSEAMLHQSLGWR